MFLSKCGFLCLFLTVTWVGLQRKTWLIVTKQKLQRYFILSHCKLHVTPSLVCGACLIIQFLVSFLSSHGEKESCLCFC